jgi:hypothetical protein
VCPRHADRLDRAAVNASATYPEVRMPTDFVNEARVFQEPGAFANMLEPHRGALSRDEIYRRAGNQELKDAWQGVMFALGYQEAHRTLTEIRICAPDQFPDFQVRINATVFDFEATIVLEDGRRLGDDYRGDQTLGPVNKLKPDALPPFDPQQLRRAVANKAAKSYAAKPHLAVYLNLKGRSVALDDLVAAVTGSEGEAFASIWVITDHHIGCVKASGEIPSNPGWLRIPIR